MFNGLAVLGHTSSTYADMSKKPPPDPIIILRGHNGGVSALSFIPQTDEQGLCDNGDHPERLLSGSDNGEIFVWNLLTFRIMYKFPKLHGNNLILWLESWNNNIISQGRDGYLKFLSLPTDKNQECNSKNVSIALHSFCRCSMLREQSLVAAPSNKTSEVLMIELERAQVVSTLNPENTHKLGMLMCLKIATEYLICGYESGDLLLWNWREKTVLSTLKGYEEPIISIAFDSALQKGIVTSITDKLHMWKVTTESKFEVLTITKTTNSGISTADIRQDSRIVATGGSDGRIRVFSWKTMKPLAVLNWHRVAVNCVQFSLQRHKKYGLMLAAGSKDGQITLWSLYN